MNEFWKLLSFIESEMTTLAQNDEFMDVGIGDTDKDVPRYRLKWKNTTIFELRHADTIIDARSGQVWERPVPKCQRNSECGGDPADYFIEYEADVDPDYSAEFGGQLYCWFGFVCQKCLDELLAFLDTSDLHRWRGCPANRVFLKQIEDSDWFETCPDWRWSSVQWKGLEDEKWAKARTWEGPMPKSRLKGV